MTQLFVVFVLRFVMFLFRLSFPVDNCEIFFHSNTHDSALVPIIPHSAFLNSDTSMYSEPTKLAPPPRTRVHLILNWVKFCGLHPLKTTPFSGLPYTEGMWVPYCYSTMACNQIPDEILIRRNGLK